MIKKNIASIMSQHDDWYKMRKEIASWWLNLLGNKKLEEL